MSLRVALATACGNKKRKGEARSPALFGPQNQSAMTGLCTSGPVCAGIYGDCMKKRNLVDEASVHVGRAVRRDRIIPACLNGSPPRGIFDNCASDLSRGADLVNQLIG